MLEFDEKVHTYFLLVFVCVSACICVYIMCISDVFACTLCALVMYLRVHYVH